jgi:hypothetical protein
MKKTLFFLFNLIFCIAVLNATDIITVTDKINSLLEDKVIELDDEELKTYTSKSFEKKIVSKLKKVDSTKGVADAVADYIDLKNYKILNAIKLHDDTLFLNYQIRSDETIHPKKESSEKVFGHPKIQHHIILLYDTKKKQITAIDYLYTQYTPILFRKYKYKDKSILYGIGNNSSSGMAITDMYLLGFSTKNLKLLFSECVMFSQSFYSSEIQDIKFEKNFFFFNDFVVINGKDFDFKKQKYIKYNRVYTFEEDPLSFNGIPFGYSREEVKTIMVEEGWTIDKEDEGHIQFKKENGDFLGIKVDYIQLAFGNYDIFYGVEIVYATGTDKNLLNQIAVFYSKRYGFKDKGETSKKSKYYEDSKENFLMITDSWTALLWEEYTKVSYKIKVE